jgi:Amt family ammonium transporter
MTSTLLVLMMALPGLALFYGGMVRAKNMLSVLMQVMTVFSLNVLLFAIYGYSLAFTGEPLHRLARQGLPVRGDDRDARRHLHRDREAARVRLHRLPGHLRRHHRRADRRRLRRAHEVLRGAALLGDLVHLATCRSAHMVWGPGGYLLEDGALDFAGGTVVHINAGVAGLVGAYMVGKRIGYGREALAPHSLTLTMVGASLLWVGWFGFNAGSNLEANARRGAGLHQHPARHRRRGAGLVAGEALIKGKPSMLGAASGAVAGLVASPRPAARWARWARSSSALWPASSACGA